MKQKNLLCKTIVCLMCMLQTPVILFGVTLNVPTAGTLEQVIDDCDEPSFQTLKIVGYLNAEDIAYIRTENGRLASIETLDLSDVTLVSGDTYYAAIKSSGGGDTMDSSVTYFYLSDESYVQNGKSSNGLGGSSYTTRYYGNQLAGAFANMKYTKVILPKNQKGIGAYSFYKCKNLTSVVLENPAENIGENAFEGCSVLTDMDLSKVTQMGDHAFFGCSLFRGNEEGVLNLSSLNKIPSSAFAGFYNGYPENSAIKRIVFSDQLTEIGSTAFVYCTALVSVDLPENIVIGSSAFYNCTSLTTVTIPSSVVGVDQSTFGETPYYKNLPAEDNIVYLNTIAISCKDKNATSLIFKEGTTEIASGFLGGVWSYLNNYLQTIQLPSSLKRIGEWAFSGAYKLTSLTLPEGLEEIGDYAFQNCSGLTSVIIPNSVTSIGEGTFYGCSGLTSITIPNSVTSIGGAAFSGCSGLTSIVFPESLESIGGNAFDGCSLSGEVTIPRSVKELGLSIFGYKSNIFRVNYLAESAVNTSSNISSILSCERLVIGPNVRTLPNKLCFESSLLKKVTFEERTDDVELVVGDSCFWGTKITEITLPNGTTSIGKKAFYYCRDLTSVTIPNSVTSIGESAFSSCYGLTFVTIGNSVTEIGDGAFYNCSGLTSVTIPGSVTSIGKQAFVWCSSLKDVYCRSEQVPNTGASVFGGINISSVTLHVPESSVSTYKGAYPWSGFGNIVALTDGELATDGELVNNINFPDATFRSWIKSQSYGQDGVLTTEEIAEVTNICVDFESIKSLQGIEFFTALKELSCIGNKIASLDVSKNTALEKLYCYSNQLTSLDVSQNTALATLHCHNNQLTSLDVSKNTELTNLHCSGNQLTSLDLSKNIKLTDLYCNKNQIKGVEMDKLIESLPSGSYRTTFAVMNYENEGNVITTIQVAAAKAKEWYAIYWNGTMWQSYAGSEPTSNEKCATPTISFVDGKIVFACETEGVEYVSEVTSTDMGKYDCGEIPVTATYTVSVYATKDGYEDSDVVTKEIVIGGGSAGIKGDVNEDGTVNGTDIQEVINIIVEN